MSGLGLRAHLDELLATAAAIDSFQDRYQEDLSYEDWANLSEYLAVLTGFARLIDTDAGLVA